MVVCSSNPCRDIVCHSSLRRTASTPQTTIGRSTYLYSIPPSRRSSYNPRMHFESWPPEKVRGILAGACRGRSDEIKHCCCLKASGKQRPACGLAGRVTRTMQCPICWFKSTKIVEDYTGGCWISNLVLPRLRVWRLRHPRYVGGRYASNNGFRDRYHGAVNIHVKPSLTTPDTLRIARRLRL